jgi:cardiolipin synthase A/B
MEEQIEGVSSSGYKYQSRSGFKTYQFEGGEPAAKIGDAYMDRRVVRRASRAVWGALLAAGVRIFEYQRTMFHCKVLIVDRKWVSVGSTNFDARSFRINDEANMNIYDDEFARRQTEVFESDLRHSTLITAEAWTRRAWTERALDRSAALLASQL